MASHAEPDEYDIMESIRNASTSPAPILGPGRPPFPGYFKIIYSTADIEATADAFFAAFGTVAYVTGPDIQLDLGGNDMAVVRTASAWAGAVLLELVQPIDDPSGYFTSVLAGDKGPRLHMLSRLFADSDAAELAFDRYRALGYPTVRIGDDSSGRLFRTDVRAAVGHHIEGVVLTDAGRDAIACLPGIGGGTMMGPGPAPLPGFYQFTYITNDFDRAIKLLCDVHGMDHFLEIRPLQVALAEAQPARMNCALGYVGAMEIEVMNPIDGAVDIYTDMLPRDRFAVAHHHISRLFDSYAGFEARGAEFVGMGKPLIADNASGDHEHSRFYYVDCRAETGHYLESAIFDPPTRQWIDSIPRY